MMNFPRKPLKLYALIIRENEMRVKKIKAFMA